MPHLAAFRGVVSGNERDATRALYRYHQRFPGPGRTFERKNLICAVALSRFDEGLIRPHEATTEADRAAALAAITRDAGYTHPVLFGFRDPATEVDRLFRKAESGPPTVELTTPDGVVHRLWRVQDSELLGKLRHYFSPRKLHLLEGHARYEAALAYSEQLAERTQRRGLSQYSSAGYVAGCLVNLEDPALATAPRHRVRGELDGDKVIAAARTHFIVEKLPGSARDLAKQFAALSETVAHQPGFIVVFAGTSDAYKLTLSPDVSPFAEGAAPHRGMQKLDPVVADNLFLARAVPGATMTTELDLEKAFAALDRYSAPPAADAARPGEPGLANRYSAAPAADAPPAAGAAPPGEPANQGASAIVVMRPLTVEQIAHVDELGQRLPPNSTAFFPAIAEGLIEMPVDVDEDLV